MTKTCFYLIAAIGFAPLFKASAEIDWFGPVEHNHLSGSGAPLIHPFGVEPAFTHRDLFLDYAFLSGDEDEHELEVELEWALTSRLGVIAEIPFVFGEEAEGFGDFAISPRALLVETDRFLLAANLEVEIPIGDESLGFGEEVKLAPSLSTFHDLGDWWTLHTQFGWERGLDSGEDELFFRPALIKTFGDTGDHNHLHAGHLSLVLESEIHIGLEGDEKGEVAATGIVGLYYGLAEDFDFRIGYQFPLSTPRELDGGVRLGLVKHF